MLILNFLPLALGYLLKCYKFHKQGFGEAWDKGMHEAFALLKEGRLGKRPFRLKDLPNDILMEPGGITENRNLTEHPCTECVKHSKQGCFCFQIISDQT